MSKHSGRSSLAVAFLSVALAACAATPGLQNGGWRSLSGTLTALSADRGTLTVAGEKLSTANALSVSLNGQPVRPGALAVGQAVTVEVQDGRVVQVDVRVELRGRVEARDASRLTVAGQVVLLGAATRIDLSGNDDALPATGRDASLIAVGDFVEVSGQRGASGIEATLIEVKSAQELAEDGENEDTHLGGSVSGLDTTAKTFRLGGLTVDYSLARLDDGVLADGASVRVEGTLSGTLLAAKEIEVESSGGEAGDDGRDGSDDSSHESGR